MLLCHYGRNYILDCILVSHYGRDDILVNHCGIDYSLEEILALESPVELCLCHGSNQVLASRSR